jgi:hypothetical protein
MPNPIHPETQAEMLAYANQAENAEHRNELIKHLITGNAPAFEQLKTQIESTS